MVKIYTKDYCPYCHKAKALLDSLNVEYQEIEVSDKPDIFKEAIEKSGFTTVPQIFVGDTCLGGCDDIHALHAAGKLLEQLQA